MSKPNEGAAAVIFDDAGRVLLIRENYDRYRWGLPGGAVEEGETPAEAALRETNEETGLIVSVDHLIGSYTLDTGFTAHAFRCRIVQGVPEVPDTGEIAEVVWHAADSLPKPVSNLLHYAIPDALRNARNVVRMNLPRVS